MQYLRARYYDPASGIFNRFDPFSGRMQDPQSLHKYLYVHGDPIQGIDPSGLFLKAMMSSLAFRASLAGTLIGAAVGGYFGGWGGGGVGAAGGSIMGYATATGNARLLLMAAAGTFYGIRRTAQDEWGVKRTNSPKKVAVVVGPLGMGINFGMFLSNVSYYGFAEALHDAGHDATVYDSPNEDDFVNILNKNDIVLVLSHSPADLHGDYTDSQGRAFTGFNLGGVSGGQHVDAFVSGAGMKAWAPDSLVTANEIDGRITNSDLILATAGCRAVRTNRIWQAMRSDPTDQTHLVGSEGLLNVASMKVVMQYVVDLVNSDHATAAQKFSNNGPQFIVDPTNSSFPSDPAF